jgi:hypothetical protein
MTLRPLLPALAAGLAALGTGCQEAPVDPWWELPAVAPPPVEVDLTGYEVSWIGQLEVEPGASAEGWGDFAAVNAEGDDVCVAAFDIVSTGVGDCDDCVFSFELQLHSVTIEVDTECEVWSVSASSLEASADTLGLREGGGLARRRDGVWATVGTAIWEQGLGELWFEEPVPVTP